MRLTRLTVAAGAAYVVASALALSGGLFSSLSVQAQAQVQAQTPAPAGSTATAPGGTGRRYVALGCVGREPSTNAAAPARFFITDTRGDQPVVYRLEGDEKELTFHVGHTVEVAGTLRTGSATDTGPNAKALILRIASLAYLSRTCTAPK